MTDLDFDIDGHFKVEGWGGIAWYCAGFVEEADEDTEWTGYKVIDKTRLRMVMVGDDEVHIFDVSEVEPIDEESFCRECGQIGCGHNVYS